MKNFLDEFRQFAVRGNVIDLAIGIIIGSAFGKIVSSLVGDIALPLLGFVIGDINLTALHIGRIAIGNFLQASIDFIAIAFVIFLMIQMITTLKKKEISWGGRNAPNEIALLAEIRDVLKKIEEKG